MNSSLAKQVTGVRLCLGMYPLWKYRTFTVSRELLSFPWVLLLTESVSCLLSRSPVCHWHYNYLMISASISHPDLKLKLVFFFFWAPHLGSQFWDNEHNKVIWIHRLYPDCSPIKCTNYFTWLLKQVFRFFFVFISFLLYSYKSIAFLGK